MSRASRKLFESVNSCMSAFVYSARVRIKNESSIKKMVYYTNKCLMNNPITYLRFVNMASLRIIDVKSLIVSMSV